MKENMKNRISKNVAAIKRQSLFIAVLLIALFCSTVWTKITISTVFTVPTASAAIVPVQPSNQGLVGYWKFDEGETATAKDYSGNRLNGTLNNFSSTPSTTSGWQTKGKINGSIALDGVDDYVHIGTPSALNITGDLTLSAWVNPRAYTSNPCGGTAQFPVFGRITNSRSPYVLSIAANSILFGNNLTSGGDVNNWQYLIPSTSNPVNKWVHVAAVRSGTTMMVYKNGVLLATSTLLGPSVNTSWSGIRFGFDGCGNYYASGSLDELYIYNRALSSSEIAYLAKNAPTSIGATATSTASSLTNGLQLYYSFDGKNTTPTSIPDMSGNGNTGTGSSSTAFATAGSLSTGKIGQGVLLTSTTTGASYVQYIDTGSSTFNITNKLTISAWIKPNAAGIKTNTILSNARDCGGCGTYKGFNFGSTAAYNGLSFSYFDSNSSGPFGLTVSNYFPPINTWTHLVVTFNNKVTKIYANGVLISSGTIGGTGTIGTPFSFDSFVGRYGFSPGFGSSNAVYDEVRLYNRDLSVSEIQQLYKLGQVKLASSDPISAQSGTASGLVAHFTFDGKNMTSTSTLDSSGGGNTGTLNGSPRTDIGKIGQGLRFNGNGQYVSLPNSSLELSVPLSFSVWIKPVLPSSAAGLITTDKSGSSVHSGAWIDLQSNGALGLNYGNNTICGPTGRRSFATGGGVIQSNKWYHVVGIIRGPVDMSIYVNGVNISGSYSGSGTNIVYRSDSGPRIGREDNCLANYWDYSGLMDDVRIYNKALSAAEVQQLYKLGGK